MIFRMTVGTQNCARNRTVHEVENELDEKFKLASVPEPKDSAQYIIAHALGHKTVSLFIEKMKYKKTVCWFSLGMHRIPYFRIRPDPDTTGSITVGSGRIRIFTGSGCNLIRIKAELQPIVGSRALSLANP